MELLQNARGRLEEAQGTLAPKLRMAKSNVMFVKDLTNSGEKGIEDIEKYDIFNITFILS